MREEPDIVKELRAEEQHADNGKPSTTSNSGNTFQMIKKPEERSSIFLQGSIYKQIFHLSPFTMALIDPQGVLVDVNDRVFDWLGYTKEEIIGISLHELPIFTEKGKKAAQQNFLQRLHGVSLPVYEIEFLTKNHGIKIGEVSAAILRDEHGIVVYDFVLITDVTVRKKTEAALRESEKKYRLLAENVNDVIWTMTFPDLRFSYISPSNQILTGFTAEEMLNLSLDKILTDDSLELVSTVLSKEAVLEQQGASYDRSRTLILNEIRKDGKVIPVEANIRYLRNECHEAIGMIGVTRDITERKHAEEESQKLALIVRYSNELINLATSDGTMTFLNDAGCKLLGLTPQQIPSTNIMDVIPRHLKEKVKNEVVTALLQGQTWGGDLQYLNKTTNQLRDVHVMAFTIKDPKTNEVLYLANISSDITEKKQAERALRESEERFRLATSSTTDIIYEWDVKTGALSWFGDIDALLGFNKGEFPRTIEAFLHQIHPDSLSRVRTMSNNALKAHERWQGEYCIVKKDGSLAYWYGSGVGVYDSAGNTIRAVGAVTDISQRKIDEKKLQEKLDELERYKSVTVDRELKMVELKKKIEELTSKKGEEH
jgi:PAS domain S-box-containing protein